MKLVHFNGPVLFVSLLETLMSNEKEQQSCKWSESEWKSNSHIRGVGGQNDVENLRCWDAAIVNKERNKEGAQREMEAEIKRFVGHWD